MPGRRSSLGLVHEVVPQGEVAARAQAVAESIAAAAPIALRYTKEAVLRGVDMDVDAGLRLEADLNILLQSTADRAEGVRSFLERRAHRFRGTVAMKPLSSRQRFRGLRYTAILWGGGGLLLNLTIGLLLFRDPVWAFDLRRVRPHPRRDHGRGGGASAGPVRIERNRVRTERGMARSFETLLFHKEAGVAYVTLDRPHVLNAYNAQMRDDLWQALEAVRDDPEVGAAVLGRSPESGAFCAGADLTEFGAAPSQAIARQVRFERDVWGLLLSLRVPVVAALHGYVLGAGLEMALLCDLRIASEDAEFGLPEAALGMAPAAGGSQTLPRIAGVPAALDLLLSARRIDSAEALRQGLVHRVVPRERLGAEATAQAERLAATPRPAMAALKESVHRGADLPLDEALSLEERLAHLTLAGVGR